jgi:hypothetical protein
MYARCLAILRIMPQHATAILQSTAGDAAGFREATCTSANTPVVVLVFGLPLILVLQCWCHQPHTTRVDRRNVTSIVLHRPPV